MWTLVRGVCDIVDELEKFTWTTKSCGVKGITQLLHQEEKKLQSTLATLSRGER